MRTLSILAILLSASAVFAHGEDKPGPHGGNISMPGAFHIELVSAGRETIKGYLLDLEWKNPVTKNSSLQLMHGRVEAKCTVRAEAFECVFPKSVDLGAAGRLTAKGKRDGQVGQAVTYQLPLKFHSKN